MLQLLVKGVDDAPEGMDLAVTSKHAGNESGSTTSEW